jgi:hypothetical protein
MIEAEYPKDLPVSSLNTLLSRLRGSASNAEAIHAAWVVLGYGLHLGMPVKVFGDNEATLKEEAAIMELLENEPNVAGGPLASIALSVVIKLALKILSESILS